MYYVTLKTKRGKKNKRGEKINVYCVDLMDSLDIARRGMNNLGDKYAVVRYKGGGDEDNLRKE